MQIVEAVKIENKKLVENRWVKEERSLMSSSVIQNCFIHLFCDRAPDSSLIRDNVEKIYEKIIGGLDNNIKRYIMDGIGEILYPGKTILILRKLN